MQSFRNRGFEFSYIDQAPDSGRGDPILLIHGFASNIGVNWIGPGWVAELRRAGYRVLAFDHLGHGRSEKSYDTGDYTPQKMVSDAMALLDHAGVERAHLFGYSMGARVSAFAALEEPARVATLVLGGLGIGLVEGVGDWDPIAVALSVDDPATVTTERGKMFRKFADTTNSDRLALAACIANSRVELTEAEVARITQPTLIGVGTKDDIAGSAEDLAGLMPNAEAFDIEGRDHMLSVGDRTFKKKVIEFLAAHPL